MRRSTPRAGRSSRKNANSEQIALARRGLNWSERGVVAAEHGVHRHTLPNGLRVISVPQPHLHTVTVAMFVKVGARYETETTNGISHFLEHMLFRGCRRYPTAYALNRAIEDLGGTLFAATHTDSTLYQVTLPPDNLVRGMEILGELFSRPVFSGMSIEKRIVREEILEYLDECGRDVDADNLVREAKFGDHPLGMTITGSAENLRKFGKRDLRTHVKRFYVARNMVLCVAGAVDPQAVQRAAGKAFAQMPAGAPARTRAPEQRAAAQRLRYVESQGSQSDLRLSFSTFGTRDRRFASLELLARIIDDGMSTRLHRRICEELGLAYEVFASLEPFAECGVLDVGGSVEHDNLASFARHALRLLAELSERPVTRAELDKAKRRYKWQLEAILDDSQAMCGHYGLRALGGQTGHLPTLCEQVDRITEGELQAVAREIFSADQLHVAAVGVLRREEQRRLRRVMSWYARRMPASV
jgi:predicted Zn-dependent peptidase